VIAHPAVLLLAGAVAWTTAVSVAPIAAPWLAVPAYAAGSVVCHQLPERSFEMAGAPIAVCARCLGLYLGGVAGFATVVARRRRTGGAGGSPWLLLAASALPTLLTIAGEWIIGRPVGNGLRFAAALPLGAAVAMVVGAAVTIDAGQVG
jgi:uncharacterized membrane protein